MVKYHEEYTLRAQVGANRTLEIIQLTTFFGVKQKLAERLKPQCKIVAGNVCDILSIRAISGT